MFDLRLGSLDLRNKGLKPDGTDIGVGYAGQFRPEG